MAEGDRRMRATHLNERAGASTAVSLAGTRLSFKYSYGRRRAGGARGSACQQELSWSRTAVMSVRAGLHPVCAEVALGVWVCQDGPETFTQVFAG